MRKIITSICLLPLLIGLHAQGIAPPVVPEPDELGRAFLDFVPEIEIGLPIANFKANMDQSAIVGKGIGIFYRFPNQPVDLGLRFSGLTYDKIRRNFAAQIDGQDIDAVQKIKNKIWLLHGALRFEPPLGWKVRPYLEGTAGYQRFYTKTFSREKGLTIALFEDDSEVNPRFDRETLHSDWGWSFSGAIGLKIILDPAYKTALDLQIGYRQGAVGEFNVRNSTRRIQVEPADNFDLRRASLRMISVKIGVSLLGYDDS